MSRLKSTPHNYGWAAALIESIEEGRDPDTAKEDRLDCKVLRAVLADAKTAVTLEAENEKLLELLRWARDIAHGARHDTDDWSRAAGEVLG